MNPTWIERRRTKKNTELLANNTSGHPSNRFGQPQTSCCPTSPPTDSPRHPSRRGGIVVVHEQNRQNDPSPTSNRYADPHILWRRPHLVHQIRAPHFQEVGDPFHLRGECPCHARLPAAGGAVEQRTRRAPEAKVSEKRGVRQRRDDERAQFRHGSIAADKRGSGCRCRPPSLENWKLGWSRKSRRCGKECSLDTVLLTPLGMKRRSFKLQGASQEGERGFLATTELVLCSQDLLWPYLVY